MASLCRGFQRNGWECSILLASEYRSICESDCEPEYIATRRGYIGMVKDLSSEAYSRQLKKWVAKQRPTFLLFYNLSPLNLFLASAASASLAKIGLVLHDPWKMQKFNHGIAFGVVYYFVEVLQKILVKRSDFVLTLSEYGTSLVERYYPRAKGKIVEGRILLSDGPIPEKSERKTVSIIGRINPSTGHDEFIRLASVLRQRIPEVTFEIVTSSAQAVQSEFVRRANAAGVKIKYRKVLSETEIESAIARSICVFRMDKELTQSGVLPLCYRLGTPVIARDIPGLSQHICVGRTGYLLDSTSSPERIEQYVREFIKNRDKFNSSCRSAFSENWSESNFERFYPSLLLG
jgi:glycosyltransferase involved in cell wall biosynthesis